MFGYQSKAVREILAAKREADRVAYQEWLANRSVCKVDGCDDLEPETGSENGYCGFHSTWPPK